MLVNDECTSWYSRVGDFPLSVRDRRKEILYGVEQAYVASQTDPTLKCVANGTECYGGRVRVVYLFPLFPQINASLV